MPRLFSAYVIVDWSAASKPTTGADSVWIGVLKRDVRFRLAFESFNEATRSGAEALLGPAGGIDAGVSVGRPGPGGGIGLRRALRARAAGAGPKRGTRWRCSQPRACRAEP